MAAAKKSRVVEKYAPLLSRANSYEDDYDDDDDSEARRRKVRWAQTEDLTIMAAVRRLGTRWPEIAALLPGRSDDAVRNRWARLNPDASKPDPPKRRARTSTRGRPRAQPRPTRRPPRLARHD